MCFGALASVVRAQDAVATAPTPIQPCSRGLVDDTGCRPGDCPAATMAPAEDASRHAALALDPIAASSPASVSQAGATAFPPQASRLPPGVTIHVDGHGQLQLAARPSDCPSSGPHHADLHQRHALVPSAFMLGVGLVGSAVGDKGALGEATTAKASACWHSSARASASASTGCASVGRNAGGSWRSASGPGEPVGRPDAGGGNRDVEDVKERQAGLELPGRLADGPPTPSMLGQPRAVTTRATGPLARRGAEGPGKAGVRRGDRRGHAERLPRAFLGPGAGRVLDVCSGWW